MALGSQVFDVTELLDKCPKHMVNDADCDGYTALHRAVLPNTNQQLQVYSHNNHCIITISSLYHHYTYNHYMITTTQSPHYNH